MFESMLALSLATIILGLSPGPAVFATIGRALSQGLGTTYLFILGIILGDLLFSLITILGLAALAAAYSPLFIILKLIGGGYLMVLGVQSWRSAAQVDLNVGSKKKGAALVLSGFLLTASNPKDLLFFVGFLPLFVDLEHPDMTELLIASLVIVFSFLVTLSFYALLANAARQWFKNERSIRILHRVAGILMFGAGLAVILL